MSEKPIIEPQEVFSLDWIKSGSAGRMALVISTPWKEEAFLEKVARFPKGPDALMMYLLTSLTNGTYYGASQFTPTAEPIKVQ